MLTSEIKDTRNMDFAPPYTVEDAHANCGVIANMANIVVDGSNADQKISTDF